MTASWPRHQQTPISIVTCGDPAYAAVDARILSSVGNHYHRRDVPTPTFAYPPIPDENIAEETFGQRFFEIIFESRSTHGNHRVVLLYDLRDVTTTYLLIFISGYY